MKRMKRGLEQFPRWKRPVVNWWRCLIADYLWGDAFPTGVQWLLMKILRRCEDCWKPLDHKLDDPRSKFLCSECIELWNWKRESEEFWENVAKDIIKEMI